MTVISTILQAPFGQNIYQDENLNATVQTISTNAKKIFYLEIDNNDNSQDVYVKFYNVAVPDFTIDEPVLKIKVENTSVKQYYCLEGIEFDTALSYHCVTTSSNSSEEPYKPVKVFILTD